MSKGEDKIIALLKAARISFEREKTFEDLHHNRYRFDFYVIRNGAPAIIEFQGEQHYKYVSAFFKTKAEWRKAMGRDQQKISYCLAHSLPIYCVPYWDLASLTHANDLFNPSYLAKSRYHNIEALAAKKL